MLGKSDGTTVGVCVGESDGELLGLSEGIEDTEEGDRLGVSVGGCDGLAVG